MRTSLWKAPNLTKEYILGLTVEKVYARNIVFKFISQQFTKLFIGNVAKITKDGRIQSTPSFVKPFPIQYVLSLC